MASSGLFSLDSGLEATVCYKLEVWSQRHGHFTSPSCDAEGGRRFKKVIHTATSFDFTLFLFTLQVLLPVVFTLSTESTDFLSPPHMYYGTQLNDLMCV